MSQPPQQDLYVDNPRLDVAPLIPRMVNSVLEVGCGRGGFGTSLRSTLGPSARIVGIEAVASQAKLAAQGHGFDAVHVGYYPEAMPTDESFELVCFNDVLEHLLDPWQTLNSTHTRLAPGGQVLATIPSIQYAPVVWQLIRGRWDYTDAGTLDRTHIRFFTRETMIELFESTGYTVLTCTGINSVAAIWATDPLLPRRFVKAAVARLLGDRAYLHFVIVARSDRSL